MRKWKFLNNHITYLKENKGTEKIRSLRIFFFVSHRIKHQFGFRIFGRGLGFKNLKYHSLLFSEREGITKYWKIGNWSIKTSPFSRTQKHRKDFDRHIRKQIHSKKINKL